MTKDLATEIDQKKTPAKRADPIAALIAKQGPAIKAALPEHMSPEHFARVVTTAIKTNPDLMDCEPMSIVSSVMLAAQLGLEPGTFGHCYLIPYFNKHTGKRECQFQIGYRGLLELVRRPKEVKSIQAEVVCEKDVFEVELGIDQKFRHIPKLDGDRGNPRLYYAIAHLNSGGHQFCWMSKDDVSKHRKKFSKANKSPWDTDFDEMAKKTVLKRLCKTLPLSVDIAKRIDQDEKVKTQIDADMTMPQEGEEAEYQDAELVQEGGE